MQREESFFDRQPRSFISENPQGSTVGASGFGAIKALLMGAIAQGVIG